MNNQDIAFFFASQPKDTPIYIFIEGQTDGINTNKIKVLRYVPPTPNIKGRIEIIIGEK